MTSLRLPQVLIRQLRSISFPEPTWLLLEPGHPRHQTLWTSESNQFTSLGRPDEIARVRARVPNHNHPATRQSSWVIELMTLLPPVGLTAIDPVVLPIIRDHRLVAWLGWDRRGRPTTDFAISAHKVRNVLRNYWEIGELQTENRALHWMLSRSDRPIVCARRDAAIVRATPAASDLLMSLRHGKRHYFTSDAPELPQALARAIATQPFGQIKLSNHCTARFEELTPPVGCFQSLVGLEFFVEMPSPISLPLSRLTAVEREVRDLVCAGMTNGEIAKRRGCAFATVKNQVSSVLGKLGLSRRHQLLMPASSLLAIQLLRPGIKGSTVSIR
jgi:DNA-binding NarL/FixJ family response regulator